MSSLVITQVRLPIIDPMSSLNSSQSARNFSSSAASSISRSPPSSACLLLLPLRKSDHKLAHLSELLLLFLLNNLASGFLLLSTGWGTFIHGFLASPGSVVKGLLVKLQKPCPGKVLKHVAPETSQQPVSRQLSVAFEQAGRLGTKGNSFSCTRGCSVSAARGAVASARCLLASTPTAATQPRAQATAATACRFVMTISFEALVCSSVG